jgi:hypothetical protein
MRKEKLFNVHILFFLNVAVAFWAADTHNDDDITFDLARIQGERELEMSEHMYDD